MSNNAICLITFRPREIWCDFLNKFKKYKIFIIIDDISFDLSQYKKYTNINFIKINNMKCRINGFINTNFIIKKLISGWDKALYYFCFENTRHDFIWFIEDDVFFYEEDTIFNIDQKYIEDDLLSNTLTIFKDNCKNCWHWDKINLEYSLPYYAGMMCAIRLSRNMMKYIKDYSLNYKTLFFLEALFPTIAIKNNLKYSSPEELSEIRAPRTYHFEIEIINKKNIYHPVKRLDRHIFFRENMK